MKFVFINILLFIFILGPASAQKRNLKLLPSHKKQKVAHDMVESGSYYHAVEHLNDLVEGDSNNLAYILRLGEAHFFARDYKSAEPALAKAVRLDPTQLTLALFRYAECLKYNGKYLQAKKAYADFARGKYQETKQDKYKVIAKNEVNSCDFAYKSSRDSNEVEINHLGDHVNSSYSEFAPRPKDDTTLIFASLQSDSVLTAQKGEVHFSHVKLYKTNHNGQVWYIPQALNDLNSEFESTANGVYSPDKTKFYFTRCAADEKHTMICNIYVSEVKEGRFQKPKKLHGGINRKGYTTTQPMISIIGTGKKKTQVLLFVSDRPDGQGGLDLWYCTINEDGTYGKVTNMGKTVNTIRDEMSPYYNEEQEALYFSSNYHYGFGGFDIFKCYGRLGKFGKPINVGIPMNGRVDDTYYTLNLHKKEGYFVSNRPGGFALTSETCCDDIYSFRYKKQHLFVLAFKDKKSRKVIQHVNVLGTAKKSLEDTKPDSLYHRYEQGQQAEQRRVFNLKESRNHYVTAKKPGYETLNFDFKSTDSRTINKNENQALKQAEFNQVTSEMADTTFITLYMNMVDSVLAMKNEKEKTLEETEMINVKDHTISKVIAETENKMKNLDKRTIAEDLRIIINYDFDQANFFEKNKNGLDSLMALLNKYKDLKIEISSHTDTKGSHEYNDKLSQRRAVEVMNYLKKEGLAKERMNARGYGEIVPIAPNEKPDGSDNPEGRATNRRAEIRIIAPDTKK